MFFFACLVRDIETWDIVVSLQGEILSEAKNDKTARMTKRFSVTGTRFCSAGMTKRLSVRVKGCFTLTRIRRFID